MKQLLPILLLLSFAISQPAFAEQPPGGSKAITFATLEWPPYIGSKLPGQGYVAQVVREAFLPAGYYVFLDFVPWGRAIRLQNDARYVGYLPEYSAEGLPENCLLSSSFPGGPLTLITRHKAQRPQKSSGDLRPYTIGVVAGYVNTPMIDENPALRLEPATTDLMNIKKLLASRVDMIVADPYVVSYLTTTEIGQDFLAKLLFVPPVLEEKKLHICFNFSHPDANELMKIFEEGLAKLRKSGRLTTLWQQFQQQYSSSPLLRNLQQ